MNRDVEHAKKALVCIDEMREGLRSLVSLIDISNDTFGEVERWKIYKSINRTLDRWQEQYKRFLSEQA